jgi:peptidoglycan hydrolase-like protein with peptidoglycan-binding domain
MTRFKLLTIASAVAAAFTVPAALAQQSGAPDSSSSRVQQRDATGNPAGSPTQPPRSMSSDRSVNDPTLRSGSASRADRSTMGHSQYDSSTVRDVQQALQNKGYDVGPIDGAMGPRTQSALREFQQQQGLTRSGRIDRQTMSALDVRASGAGGTMSDRSSSRSGTGDRAAGTGASGSGAIGSGSPSGSAGAGGTTAAPGSISGTPSGSPRPGSEGPSGTGASGSGAIGSSPSGSGSAGSSGTTGGGRGG